MEAIEKAVVTLIDQIISGDNQSVVIFDGEKIQADEVFSDIALKDSEFDITLQDGTRFTLTVGNVRKPERHSYFAVLKDGRRLITVSAISLSKAVEEISDQLSSNPGRLPYYELWKSNGCLIEEAK